MEADVYIVKSDAASVCEFEVDVLEKIWAENGSDCGPGCIVENGAYTKVITCSLQPDDSGFKWNCHVALRQNSQHAPPNTL